MTAMQELHNSIDRRRLIQQGATAAGLAAVWGPARPQSDVITAQEYLLPALSPDAPPRHGRNTTILNVFDQNAPNFRFAFRLNRGARLS